MPIRTILTFFHSVTPKLAPETPKWLDIMTDHSQVSVPSLKLVALKPFELCCSDSQNWPRDPSDAEIDHSDPKMNRHLAWPLTSTSICTKFQVDSFKTFLSYATVTPKTDPSDPAIYMPPPSSGYFLLPKLQVIHKSAIKSTKIVKTIYTGGARQI